MGTRMPRRIKRVNGVDAFSTDRDVQPHMKRSVSLRSRAPGSSPASTSIWNPLHTPSTGLPSSAIALMPPIAGLCAAIAPARSLSPYEKPPGSTAASYGSSSGSGSPCQWRRASMPYASRITWSMSRSQLLPGNTTIPTRTARGPRAGI